MLIELARDPAEEADRNEHGAEDEHDGNDGPSHFCHGPLGSILGRTTFFLHVAHDVLDHNDRVIHHDPDSQHHAEEGQGVDGKPEGLHAGKGTDEGHWNRHAWNQGGTPALEKEIDNQDD